MIGAISARIRVESAEISRIRKVHRRVSAAMGGLLMELVQVCTRLAVVIFIGVLWCLDCFDFIIELIGIDYWSLVASIADRFANC